MDRASLLTEDFRPAPWLKFARKTFPTPRGYIVQVLSTRKTHRQLLFQVIELWNEGEPRRSLESAKRQFIPPLAACNAARFHGNRSRVRKRDNFLKEETYSEAYCLSDRWCFYNGRNLPSSLIRY